jgi:hypothetical protein
MDDLPERRPRTIEFPEVGIDPALFGSGQGVLASR